MSNKTIVKNELILKRRRKKMIKKIILISLLMISMLITLCLKLPFFNIRYIKVEGNNNISKDEIVKLSGIKTNNNIFYLNTKKNIENIKTNSYINSVDISRKLPNTMIIKVVERNAKFYIDNKNEKMVIDNNGVLLEKRNSVETMNLVMVVGLNCENIKIGTPLGKVKDDKVKIQFLTKLSDLMDRSIKKLSLRLIDLTSMYDIKIFYNDICIKLGDGYDLEKRLNKALNVIYIKKLDNSKGYIDASFQGNPVVYIEK